MKLKSININHYRSIRDVNITFPQNKPIVLFGPNNSGKTNILNAIERLLSEKYPTFIEMAQGDYFKKDKDKYPTATIKACFDNNSYMNLVYGYDGDLTQNTFVDNNGKPIKVKSYDRKKCLSYMIDSDRNLGTIFNLSNPDSIINRFLAKIDEGFEIQDKEMMDKAYNLFKNAYANNKYFTGFLDNYTNTLNMSIKGFIHRLNAILTYNPQKYINGLRFRIKENGIEYDAEELGAGEKEIIIMAFIKAYMELFKDENIVLIIEEPEKHLHPLAQKWLKEFIMDLCQSGIQVVLSTHSTSFIDVRYLDGLVRVYKENFETKAVQLTKEQLYDFCISSGVTRAEVTKDRILDYYETKIFSDQLNGLFAEKVIFVEGFTEYFAFPVYFKKINYSLPVNGIEMVVARGKEAIPLMVRIYKAYGYKCFIICDCDNNLDKTNNTFKGILPPLTLRKPYDTYILTDECLAFKKDFETYFRKVCPSYAETEKLLIYKYKLTSKQSIAKAVAEELKTYPELIEKLPQVFEKMK